MHDNEQGHRKILPLRVKPMMGGFVVEVVRRTDRIILLQKRLPKLQEFRNFEVCVIQVNTVHPRSLDTLAQGYTHIECLPTSNSWGKSGWTYNSLHAAEEAFNRAVKDYKEHVTKHGEHFSDDMEEPDDMHLPEAPEPDDLPEP